MRRDVWRWSPCRPSPRSLTPGPRPAGHRWEQGGNRSRHRMASRGRSRHLRRCLFAGDSGWEQGSRTCRSTAYGTEGLGSDLAGVLIPDERNEMENQEWQEIVEALVDAKRCLATAW